MWPLFFLSPKNFQVEADDLVTISELGRGAYGVVEKVRHAQSGTIMAVKVHKGSTPSRPTQPGSLGTLGRLPGGGTGAEPSMAPGYPLELLVLLRGMGGGRLLPRGP